MGEPGLEARTSIVGGLVLSDVVIAAERAQAKHGMLTTDPVRACAILLREGGEAINEALLATTSKVPDGLAWPNTWTPEHVRDDFRRGCVANLYAELAQVAATAMLIMENIRRSQGDAT